MNESGDAWYVAKADGSARGPYTRVQLLAMRQAGEIGDEHLLWTLALAEWIPLKRAIGGGNLAASNAQQNYVAPPPKASEAQVAPKVRKKGEARPSRAADKPAPKASSSPTPAQAATAALQRTRAQAEAEGEARVQELKAAMAAQSAQIGIAGRRLLARSIDLLVLGGLGWALLAYVGTDLGLWHLGTPRAAFASNPLLAWPLLVLAGLVLEALLLGLSGYTPGKALLGVRVQSASGQVIGLPVAFQRSFAVLLRGQALLIPPFTLIAYGLALADLQKHGRTSWDRHADLSVRISDIDSKRWWVALVALVVAWVALLEGLWMRTLN